MEPILILFNNSGVDVSVSITDYRGDVSTFEAGHSSSIKVTNWSHNKPEITIGGIVYQYSLDIPHTTTNWKGWWLFASSHINAQIEIDGSINVLNKGIDFPVKNNQDVYVTIKPRE